MLHASIAIAVAVGVALVVVVFRVIAGAMDADRISRRIAGDGGELLMSKWQPLGGVWTGPGRGRAYGIMYRNAGGEVHQAVCVASMVGGVRFVDDRVVDYPQGQVPAGPEDPGEQADVDEDEIVEIYGVRDQASAHMVKAVLANEGIEAWVINDAIQGAVGLVPAGWATAPRICVTVRDRPRAIEVLAEIDERLP